MSLSGATVDLPPACCFYKGRGEKSRIVIGQTSTRDSSSRAVLPGRSRSVRRNAWFLDPESREAPESQAGAAVRESTAEGGAKGRSPAQGSAPQALPVALCRHPGGEPGLPPAFRAPEQDPRHCPAPALVTSEPLPVLRKRPSSPCPARRTSSRVLAPFSCLTRDPAVGRTRPSGSGCAVVPGSWERAAEIVSLGRPWVSSVRGLSFPCT